MIKNSLTKLGTFLLAALASISIGFAEWTVETPPTKTVNPAASKLEPVCYYYDGEETRRGFTSIEQAVESANSEKDKTKNYEVVILPGGFIETCTITKTVTYYYEEDLKTPKISNNSGEQETKTEYSMSYSYSSVTHKNVTIERSFTINGNVTLTLPYIDEANENYKTRYVYNDFARHVYEDSKGKKTTVKPTETTAKGRDPTSYEKSTYEKQNVDGYLYRLVDNQTTFSNTSTRVLDSTYLESNDTDVHSVFAGYMTLNVDVASGVTITNKGTIRIAGKQSGAGGGKMASFVTHFAQLTLEKNSKLVCEDKSKLICFGYIKGSDSYSTTDNCTDELSKVKSGGYGLELKTGSTAYVPFVVIEHRGGSVFYGLSSDGIKGSPFNRFYFPNLTNVVTLISKCTIYAVPDLYASSQHNRCYVNLIGSNSSFMIQAESDDFKIVSYFQVFNNASTYKNGLQHKPNHNLVFRQGVIKLNALSLNAGVKVSTESCHLPVSCYYSLKFESGSLNSNKQKIKLLYGSYVNVASGYKISLPGIAVYGDDTYGSGMSDISGAASAFKYEQYSQAECIINGTLCADYACGYFKTSSSDGRIEAIKVEDSLYEVENLNSGTRTKYYTCKAETYVDFLNSTTETIDKHVVQNGNLISSNSAGLHYFTKADPTPISKILIVGDSGVYKSPENKEATFDITATIFPLDYLEEGYEYTWEWDVAPTNQGDTNLASIEDSKEDISKATLTLKANGGKKDIDYLVTLTIKYGNETITSNSLTYTACYDSGCLLPTAKILMADGSYKEAGSIKAGDRVISFNHETGKFEANQIIANIHSGSKEELRKVLHLSFSNGSETDLIYEHGYFDLTTNRYEYIREDNYDQFIGHEFVCLDGNSNMKRTVLKDAYVYELMTRICSPVSANGLNIVSDNMLSITGCVSGLFNIFDYDPVTLAFDKEKKASDIAKYGLLDYTYFKDYLTEDAYNVLPCKYLGVAIGKGMIDWDTIERYAKMWGKELFV